ncbi:MAG: branched-chain amino acid ABC transporter permease [Nitrososphaerales archaeon]
MPIALLLAVPLTRAPYILSFSFLLLIYLTLAESYDVLSGYSGYMNLGHVCFFAIGGYTLAVIVTKFSSFPLALAFLLSPLSATIFALFISYPLFRLRGAYFAIASLALGILLYYIFVNPSFDWLAGGMRGLMINTSENRSIISYYLAVSIAIIAILTHYSIPKTKLGLALLAIKDNEDVAKTFGIAPYRAKTQALVISASIAGFAGGVYVYGIGYVNPLTVLNTEILLTPVVMTLIGGTGIYSGPLTGAVLLMIIQEVLWVKITHFHLFIYGLILVLVGLFMPGGLLRQTQIQKIITRLKG